MLRSVTIALDAMGGDYGPSIAVAAAADVLRRSQDLQIILVGNAQTLRHLIPADCPQERLSIVDAPDVVTMDEKPSSALRRKTQSSMAIALQLVKDGAASACVSAGNTGALMALGRAILKTPSGIERPAIIKRIPSIRGRCYVLDLGANVDCSAEHLYQFGLLGSLVAEFCEGKARPRVALVNVGSEETKGSEQVRLASHLLAESPELNYVGFIEGDEIFKDKADVVVCDGFVGNVALKTSEGVIEMLAELTRNLFQRSWYTRMLAVLARPVLQRLTYLLDPATHNGASLIGLNGVVVKSHGAAREKAFASAIEQAVRESRLGLPDKINARLDQFFI